jgi:hypothetical protein
MRSAGRPSSWAKLEVVNHFLIPRRVFVTLLAMDPGGRGPNPPSDSLDDLMHEVVSGDEEIQLEIPGVGCRLVLTDRRLIVLREGASFRPRTGVRDWSLDGGLTVRYGLIRHGTGSLAIDADGETTTVFIKAEDWDSALRLVGALRRSIRVAQQGDLPA